MFELMFGIQATSIHHDFDKTKSRLTNKPAIATCSNSQENATLDLSFLQLLDAIISYLPLLQT